MDAQCIMIWCSFEWFLELSFLFFPPFSFEGCWCGKMGFAEAELESVWKRLMVKILSEKPSAKCPFNFIIMEKGGYWVGVFIWFHLSLPLFPSLPPSLPLSLSTIGRKQKSEKIKIKNKNSSTWALIGWIAFMSRLMGKVASDKCHKWVFKEPSECEPNVSNYWQSSFDAVSRENLKHKRSLLIGYLMKLITIVWANSGWFDKFGEMGSFWHHVVVYYMLMIDDVLSFWLN